MMMSVGMNQITKIQFQYSNTSVVLLERIKPGSMLKRPYRILACRELLHLHCTTVTSLDFHPSQHTLLLVGCTNGDITLWEAGDGRNYAQSRLKFGICRLVH